MVSPVRRLILTACIGFRLNNPAADFVVGPAANQKGTQKVASDKLGVLEEEILGKECGVHTSV